MPPTFLIVRLVTYSCRSTKFLLLSTAAAVLHIFTNNRFIVTQDIELYSLILAK
jgi:hypothetical protein